MLDLLYGMMLPSGNDAALTLAEGLGRHIVGVLGMSDKQGPETFFMVHVNRLLAELGLTDTALSNPHGLPDPFTISSAFDMACFTAVALQNQLFRTIVQTQSYSTLVYNERTGLSKTLHWVNTNKLLQKGHYFGVKTGVTESAGPCYTGLCCLRGESYLVVLLNAESLHSRFLETEAII
jgi:D-alanyl-D-alanine carboxypeptidase (penicillin-binding protein 5/6)